MARGRDFRHEQRAVAAAMAAALVTALVALGIAAAADRTGVPMPFVDRLRFAIRADAFVAIWLAATIANVARLRFFSERDIAGAAGDAGSQRVREAAAILQNTLEQAGLAIVAHVATAATFERSVTLVATLVGLFTIGRLLFWIGYRHGAAARAFGFALTFYPSVLVLLASAVAIALPGP